MDWKLKRQRCWQAAGISGSAIAILVTAYLAADPIPDLGNQAAQENDLLRSVLNDPEVEITDYTTEARTHYSSVSAARLITLDDRVGPYTSVACLKTSDGDLMIAKVGLTPSPIRIGVQHVPFQYGEPELRLDAKTKCERLIQKHQAHSWATG